MPFGAERGVFITSSTKIRFKIKILYNDSRPVLFIIDHAAMPDLKPLSKEAIPEALEKARHYRLLNEPWQAESICRDILLSDSENQVVIYTLILAITDQFDGYVKTAASQALELADRLKDPYEAEYCRGLIYERRAIAAYRRQKAGSGNIAHSFFERAMKHYEQAEKLQSGVNRDAILRWNACVRFIQQHKLKPSPKEKWVEPFLDV